MATASGCFPVISHAWLLREMPVDTLRPIASRAADKRLRQLDLLTDLDRSAAPFWPELTVVIDKWLE